MSQVQQHGARRTATGLCAGRSSYHAVSGFHNLDPINCARPFDAIACGIGFIGIGFIVIRNTGPGCIGPGCIGPGKVCTGFRDGSESTGR